MLSVQLITKVGIVILEPDGALTVGDFEAAAEKIDPFIEERGRLNGLIIRSESFPGWDSFAALTKHLSFVRNHHQKISRVALVTDSPIGKLAEVVAGHFVNAEVKVFKYEELEEARSWILESKNNSQEE
ncbi:MAG: STAS/SEC14 domain-containing protein [Gammaproteobacteria bacterium]|nr:STAS/SEC14 domain-containing protein [Gammaproteobacteria bacterium]HXK56000.1 STAS/SEC14 domain-containing protein [Gammaproteobacteria bacterium]